MPRLHRLVALLLTLVGTTAFGQPLVRVLLAVEQDVTVVAEGPHAGTLDSVPVFRAPLGLRWPVGWTEGSLLIDGRAVGKTFLLDGRGSPLEFGGRRYRGAIRLTATPDGIEVINVVDVEEYLRGVVPAEMSASWPMEALKAQAVAARSYTVSSLEPTRDYDLCATVDCQVYHGMEEEHPRSDAAVFETRGIIVSYDDRPARTYYHADSGGRVASAAEVWGTPYPYLVSRPDVPSGGPHASWRTTVEPGRVAASLSSLGSGVGTVTGLRVLTLTESGRVGELEVDGSAGRTVLDGVELTRLARSWGLKSTRFRVASGLTVTGEGWGHGVGMSQYGARALARSQHDYAQILGYYYPNTTLKRMVIRQTAAP